MNYGTGDIFVSPAPPEPWGSTLSVFNGTNPNGVWSLYIFDDARGDAGSVSGGWSLTLSVGANTPPTVSHIANQSINGGTSTGPLSFTVGDNETPAASLSVSVSSSNPTLVPSGGLVLGGSGANRTLTVTPALGQSGTATITVTVNDGLAQTSDSFQLTVVAVNTPPTLSAVGDVATLTGTPTPPIPFVVGDVETPASSLTVAGASSNQSLVPNGSIAFGGSGSNRTVVVTPAPGLNGSAVITLTVTDGNSASTSTNFNIVVSTGVGSATFSNPGLVSIPSSGPATPSPSSILVSGMSGYVTKVTATLIGVNHTFPDDLDVLLVGPGGQSVMLMSDAGGGADLVDVTLGFDDAATASLPDNTQIVAGTYKPTNYDVEDVYANGGPQPPFGATFSGFVGTVPNGTWSLWVIDDSPQDSGTITGGWTLSLTTDANTPPSISSIQNITLAQDTPSGPLAFTMGDAETPVGQLVLKVASSSTDLVPTNNLVIGGSGASRTITVTPVSGVFGSTTITLTVTDAGGLSTSTSFLVTVTQAGTPVVKIATTSWSLQVDGNHNNYYESARLNWDPDVPAGGSQSVFEKIYWRTNDAPWVLLYTTAPHTITGVGAGDAQFYDVALDPMKYMVFVDYKIELYVNGAGTPSDIRLPANDPTLNDHKEEGLPDLIVWGPSVIPNFSTKVYQDTDCAVTHGCTLGGTRRLLEFALVSYNIGHSDLYIGSPLNNPSFVWDPCHGHYHFQGFATYRLMSGNTVVAAGNKVGFCLEDGGRFDTNANSFPKYNCSDQGIQAGWYDHYGLGLTCQWIDITGVPTGDYTLEVAVNPWGLLQEANYANNLTQVPVTVTNTAPLIRDIADQSTLPNTPTPPIAFTVWDAETAWNSLALSASSSNPGLVPVGNIVFAGSGTARTVTVTPVGGQSGSANITITVTDGNGGTASTTFLLNVNNELPPVVTLTSGAVVYTENDPPLIIDAGATVTDADSPNFNGGSLTVDITENPADEDRLEVRNQGAAAGQVGVSSGNVTWGGVVVGTVSGGTNGTSPLVITFTSTAVTPLVAQSIATNITYRNASDNPSPLPRTVRFVVNDGVGGFSPSVTRAVSIIAVNDPPVVTLSPGSATYVVSGAPVPLDASAVVTDVDSADFQLGAIKFTITGNPSFADRLALQPTALISITGNEITYGGGTLGSMSGGTDGSTPLIINFDIIPSIVTPAVCQDLVRNVVFWNVAPQPSALTRVVDIELADGDGATNHFSRSIVVTSQAATPVITWGAPAAITYGTALGASQLNATANVPGTFVYSPPAGTVLNAGAGQILSVTFTPTDSAHYTTATATVPITVQKAVPVVTWASPAGITYGTPLGAAQLNATANVPGSFSYTPPAGTVLHAGSPQPLQATFTPTDAQNYTAVGASVGIAVAPAPLTVSGANASRAYGAANPAFTPVYTGLVNGDTPAVIDTPPTLSSAATATSPVGPYAIVATGGGDADYVFSYTTGTLTVTPAVLTVTADNKSKVQGTGNPTLTVSYSGFVGSDSAATLTSTPTATTTATTGSPAGTYPITVSGGAAPNYTLSHVAGTLTVSSPILIPLTQSWTYTSANLDTTPGWTAPAFNDLSWASGGALLYFETNELVTPRVTPLPGVQPTYYFRTHFQFSGVVIPGLQLVFSNLLDDGGVFYLNGTEVQRLRVPAAPQPITYSTLATATPTGGDATSFDVFAVTGTPLSALVQGDNVLAVEVHQVAGTSDVVFGSAVSLRSPVPSVITWSNPGDIVYGTALSGTQLNATANVPGTFSYTPAAGTVLPAGAGQVLSVTFTPDDIANYSASSATVLLNVAQAPLVVTAASASKAYGAPVPALGVSYSGFVNNDTAASLTTAPTATTTCLATSPVGNYATTAGGGVAANYSFSYVSGNLAVTQVGLTITADDKTRPKGLSNPPLTASYSGFVNGDGPGSLSPGVSLSTTATPASAVGTYPITASGAANPNYTITYVPGVMSVTAPVITGVTVTPPSPSINVGGTQQFSASASLSDSTAQDVTATATWGSGSTGVATINAAGLATAVTSGSSQISAAYSGFTGQATLTVTPVGNTFASFTNAASITIPSSGPATPYPSTIAVSGLSGTITKITATLRKVNHTYPDDIDILLEGPAGQRILLMSDAGGSPDLVNVDLTFDDAATASLPDETLIAAGTYKPTNYGAGDIFYAPAPAAPYGSALADFTGTNPNGTWSLYVIDDAGGDSGSIASGWSLSISTGANSPPSISHINNISVNEDTSSSALAFTVGDVETPAASLTVSGNSSNPTLVPVANLVFGGSEANRTVVVTPAANQFGTSTITLTVSDGITTTSDSFLVTVISVNDLPTISTIPAQSILKNTSTPAIGFTVGDVETAAGSLTLSAASSNPTLVPVGNIVFGGSGAARTVTVTPASGQTGSASISVIVSDTDGGSATNIFALTVSDGAGVATFSNTSAIAIPDSGPAVPYPSTLTVSGMIGTITKVTVTLKGVSHTYPDDIDALLVGPGGQNTLLMSDAGGGPDLLGINLVFDDAATASLPDETQIAAGTYKPTNYGAGDLFPAPAPSGTYPAALSTFVGTAPNGVWSLFLNDDSRGDQGSVSGGWSITITTTAAPPPPPAPAGTDPGVEVVAPIPMSIDKVQFLGANQVKITVRGTPGQRFVIEHSKDLKTWTLLTTDTLVGATFEFTATLTDGGRSGFFRTSTAP
jgi:subtilisin-like proprotein convertase family protein